MSEEVTDETKVKVETEVDAVKAEVEAEAEKPPVKLKYKVEVVEQTTAPEGMSGDNWCRYVIGKGASRVEGKAPGSLKKVTEHAEELAEGFNSRMGKGGSAYASRKRS